VSPVVDAERPGPGVLYPVLEVQEDVDHVLVSVVHGIEALRGQEQHVAAVLQGLGEGSNPRLPGATVQALHGQLQVDA